jgi:hypothetical protein
MKTKYPHVPAAFINALAEEGTKEQCIEWLQKIWNELCYKEKQLEKLSEVLELFDYEIEDEMGC